MLITHLGWIPWGNPILDSWKQSSFGISNGEWFQRIHSTSESDFNQQLKLLDQI